VVSETDAVVPAAAPAQNHVDDGREYCVALYDYDAASYEELSFMEGDILVVLKKTPHDVDDGWWEGEINGQQGLFPSLVVEPCGPDGSPLTPEVRLSPSPPTRHLLPPPTTHLRGLRKLCLSSP
jgi:hypothetical protein